MTYIYIHICICHLYKLYKKNKGDWKQRYYNHTMSFRNQKHKNDTAFSTFLSELKKSTKETPKLTWYVLKVVPGNSNSSKRCLLCLNEKLLIATYPDQK